MGRAVPERISFNCPISEQSVTSKDCSRAPRNSHWKEATIRQPSSLVKQDPPYLALGPDYEDMDSIPEVD